MRSTGITTSLIIWTAAFVGIYVLSAIPGSAKYKATIGGLIVVAAVLFTAVLSLDSPQR